MVSRTQTFGYSTSFIFNPSLSNVLFLMTVKHIAFTELLVCKSAMLRIGVQQEWTLFFYSGSGKEIDFPETSGSFLTVNIEHFQTFKEKLRDGESKTELRSILLKNLLFPFCLLSEIPFSWLLSFSDFC